MSDAVLVLLGAVGGILSGLAALMGARRSKHAGVSGDEREARRDKAAERRDTIADRDSLVDRLGEEVRRLDAALKAAREHATEEITAMKKRLDVVELEYERERRWSQLLIDHIAQQRGWPPPPRPTD